MPVRAPLFVLLVAMPVLLSACGGKAPCAICYEDEWSRTPFPGQQTQHLPPLPDPKHD